ncbi:DUF1345 domain-containing protein [Microlunatus ginsengisoli]|uniref:DUF1345 domain-containing protein n=1 Tax=Microlunatus ginsengisoli TaxID=363863 RepID=A0ABP6ZNT0_9ACTN
MVEKDPARSIRWSAVTRLVLAVGAGLVVSVLAGLITNAPLALLGGLATMALVFDLSGVAALWPMSSEVTRASVSDESFRPIVAELTVVAVACGGVAGIVVLLVLGRDTTRTAAAAVGLVGVFMLWGMLHLMYAVRYADLYYSDSVGGIDFNNDVPPAYRDFFYFSYNLGMTYQVSDTSVSDPAIRSVVLRHCLLSYLFGTVILASTINLIAGIVTS